MASRGRMSPVRWGAGKPTTWESNRSRFRSWAKRLGGHACLSAYRVPIETERIVLIVAAFACVAWCRKCGAWVDGIALEMRRLSGVQGPNSARPGIGHGLACCEALYGEMLACHLVGCGSSEWG